MIFHGTKTYLSNNLFRLVSRENQFNLIFDGNSCPFKDFIKYSDGIFIKHIDKSEIENAYSFETLAFYKNHRFQIDKVKGSKVLITTSEKKTYEELKLDFVDRGWYEKWVSISELEKIWEERKPSGLGFPYPNDLPEIEEIKINPEN